MQVMEHGKHRDFEILETDEKIFAVFLKKDLIFRFEYAII